MKSDLILWQIVLVRDSRVSGEWIEKISIGVIQSMGLNVVVCGIQPTPTAQLLAQERENSIGAIVVTSSHNPIEWNVSRFINLFIPNLTNHLLGFEIHRKR